MTNNNNIFTKKLAVLFSTLAVLLGIFRGIVSAKFIDAGNGLYTNAAIGNIFLALLAVVLAITVASYPLLKKKQYPDGLSTASKSTRGASLICAAALVALIISGLINIVSAGILAAIELVICIPAVVYFALSALGKNAATKGVLPLFTALWIGIRTIKIFINVSEQINASGRSFTLLFLVCAMLYFLAESEFFIPLTDDEKKAEAYNKRCAKLITTAFATFELALIFAGSEAVLIILGACPVTNLIPRIAELSISVYALSRAFDVK